MMPKRHRGFTLIELLVVMVVLGVAVAMIAVNFPPDPRRALDAEAQRLALLLQQARDEAMTTGSGIAFSADENGYRFWRRQPLPSPQAAALQAEEKWPGKQWQPDTDAEVFRPRRLPTAVTLGELSLSGQVAAKDARRIVFSPSGVAQPFRLALAAGTYQTVVAGDANGNIHVE